MRRATVSARGPVMPEQRDCQALFGSDLDTAFMNLMNNARRRCRVLELSGSAPSLKAAETIRLINQVIAG